MDSNHQNRYGDKTNSSKLPTAQSTGLGDYYDADHEAVPKLLQAESQVSSLNNWVYDDTFPVTRKGTGFR